jgi:hypothetical protein
MHDVLPAGDLFMMRKQLQTLAGLAAGDAVVRSAPSGAAPDRPHHDEVERGE